jgi:hypothetical protein
MSLDWLAGYELRRGWRGPSPKVVVAQQHAQQHKPLVLYLRLRYWERMQLPGCQMPWLATYSVNPPPPILQQPPCVFVETVTERKEV